MILLYQLGIHLYYFAAKIAALWSGKAKKWVLGQHQTLPEGIEESIWFHFASLGEYEQGRTVLEALREQYVDLCLVVTFFSPSGYEIRKNTPLADYVLYLPLDSPKNATDFIERIKPRAVFFTKYEYWYFYYTELKKRGIPLYLFSAIFRPKQIFFSWYGGLHRQMLNCVSHIFVQNEVSKFLLDKISIRHVTISGDTRFDRALQNVSTARKLPLIENFAAKNHVVVAGSTWPADENLLLLWLKSPVAESYKLIIAPHEVEPHRIGELMKKLGDRAVRYSELVGGAESGVLSAESANSPFTTNYLPQKVLVIDNIGMLSSLYQYGHIAYIGGGFGDGIHNTLEAAAFGLPVIFGPNYHKFQEAKDLIKLGAAFSIASNTELINCVITLHTRSDYELAAGKARNYVAKKAGATQIILQNIAPL